jgi:hypothetical protein
MVYFDKNSYPKVRTLLVEAEREIREPQLEPIERRALAQRVRDLIDSMIDQRFEVDEWL